MAKTSQRTTLAYYARLGAEAKLRDLKAQISDIERMFPGIGGTPMPAAPRRGRPPKAATVANETERQPRKRRGMTAAQRKAVGERMRRYWAERRKAEGGKKR
jgi:hypothetical protein